MSDRYAVVGNPIAHSLSPEIHQAFARALGHEIVYEQMLAPLDGFSTLVGALRSEGIKGINVTMPFKLEAFEYASRCTLRAQLAGAANTLKFDATGAYGPVFADNTDGAGLVRDIINNLQHEMVDRSILVIGAGGAARGVMGALMDENPKSISISNRTIHKATELARRFSNINSAVTIEALDEQQLIARQFDIVINATSASFENTLPQVPPTIFAPAGLAYDMVYGRGATPFLNMAAKSNATIADGLGMLVEQAAEAFLVFRSVRPKTESVIAAVRQRIQSISCRQKPI